MNEFQAILTVVTLFAVRFVLPVVVIFGVGYLIDRHLKAEEDAQDIALT